MIEMKQTLNLAVNSSSDWQESTNNIKCETDDKKSDDQTHQIIRSFETKNSVDNLLQDQQQELPQVQQVERQHDQDDGHLRDGREDQAVCDQRDRRPNYQTGCRLHE